MDDSEDLFSYIKYFINPLTGSLILIGILFLTPLAYYIVLLNSRSPVLYNRPFNYSIFIIFGLLLSFFITKKIKNKISPETNRVLIISLKILIIAYALFLLLMTCSRYLNFISEAIDVSYYHYTIWQLSEFKIPYIWEGSTIPVWSQHFEPILIFFIPIYWFIKSTTLLMFLQALTVISGAIPIYLTVRDYLKSKLIGISLAFTYLSFGGLQFGIAYGFHPIMLFPAIFLWSYYFYQKKNTKLYLIFVILSLFVKEEVAFILFSWSIYLIFIKRDKKLGSISAILALLWYFLCFNIVFPYFNKGAGFGYWGQYDQAGGEGLMGIIKPALSNPFKFLLTLINQDYKVNMLIETFGHFSFLLIFFPPALIIILPSLLEKLLSSNIAGANGAHYSAAITGVTVIATIESLSFILKRRTILNKIGDPKLFLGSFIIFLAFSSNIFYGYRGYSLIPPVHGTIYETGLTTENDALLRQVLTSIPQHASVSAQYQIAPHIQKPIDKIRHGPSGHEDTDFVIIDTQLLPVLATAEQLNKNIDILQKDQRYKMAINSYGVVVFRKTSFK